MFVCVCCVGFGLVEGASRKPRDNWKKMLVSAVMCLQKRMRACWNDSRWWLCIFCPLESLSKLFCLTLA